MIGLIRKVDELSAQPCFKDEEGCGDYCARITFAQQEWKVALTHARSVLLSNIARLPANIGRDIRREGRSFIYGCMEWGRRQSNSYGLEFSHYAMVLDRGRAFDTLCVADRLRVFLALISLLLSIFE
jgi:hypothetical protein